LMPVRIDVNPVASGSGGAAAGLVERAVRAALNEAGALEAEISVTLLDDAGMAAMNREWKGRDGPTDVLAFPLHAPGEPPLGDVYVGFERAAAQGAELGEPHDRELARLAVHGTLHILGWE